MFKSKSTTSNQRNSENKPFFSSSNDRNETPFFQKKPDTVQLKEENTGKKFYGGEVTNDSDISWLISGGSNSDSKDFKMLLPGQNSDDLDWTERQLGGDVDAVWPAGMMIKNYYTGEEVDGGVFKLKSHRNTNIDGNKVDGYRIWDFSVYYKEGEMPSGWKLPDEWKH